jgi:hypothetical protein
MMVSSVPSPSNVSTQPKRFSISSGSRFSVGVPIASPITPNARQAKAWRSKRLEMSAGIVFPQIGAT